MIDIRLAARSLLTAVAVVLGVVAFMALFMYLPAHLVIMAFGPAGLAIYVSVVIILVIAFCLYLGAKDDKKSNDKNR